MKAMLGIFLLGLVALFMPSSLLACNCVSRPLEQYKSEADVVFVGVALDAQYGDRGVDRRN